MLLAKFQIFGLENILFSAIAPVCIAALLLLMSEKLFGVFQQLGYNINKFRKWSLKSDNMIFSRLTLMVLLTVLSFAVVNLSLSFFDTELDAYFGFATFLLFSCLYIYADRKVALKVSLKNTARVKRLKATFFVLVFFTTAVVAALFSMLAYFIEEDIIILLRFLPLSIIPLLAPFFVMASGGINAVYESNKNKKFIESARQKLKNIDIIKIGITGSYGKTGVKNILKTILEEKYKTVASPHSYNTPIGLAKTINQTDFSGAEIFIAEMGARNIGDIKELAELVEIDHAILTGVTTQHLETFLSLDGVKQAKYEIVEGTKKVGTVVFGDDSVKDLYESCALNKLLAGKDITAENLKLSSDGASFDLVYKGERAACTTKLLGAHNVENILTAALMALRLGLSLSEASVTVKKIEFEKHRLELIKSENGLNILDDSYNANIKGAEQAIGVLQMFGGSKIVITPGIVELGVLEKAENFKLGEKLAVCDYIILIGQNLAGIIKDGALAAGFDEKKIFTEAHLNAATERLSKIVKKGDTVLFLNDLPDVF